MKNKIVRTLGLVLCISLFFLILNSCSADSTYNLDYKEMYYDAEDKIYELEEENISLCGTIETYHELSHDLMNAYTPEVENALLILQEARESGSIEDFEVFWESYDIVKDYLYEMYDYSIDLDVLYFDVF